MSSFSQQEPSSQKKKTVTFACQAKAKRTIHVDDYTDEEIDATWYSCKELIAIRQEICDTVELMLFGEPMPKGYCTRGLEYQTPELFQKRTQNKLLARNAVLNLQEEQIENGIYDEEGIAQVYQDSNYHCQLAATLMGAADEKATSKKNRHRRHQNSSHRKNSSRPSRSSRGIPRAR